MCQQKPASPTIIEKFRQQSEREIRLTIVLVILLVVGIVVPVGGQMIPIVRAQPIWRGFLTVWGCLMTISFIGLCIAAALNNHCPACGMPLSEDFWMARYCQHCGTQLREK